MSTSPQAIHAVRRVVGATAALGVLSVIVVAGLSATLWADLRPAIPSSPVVIAAAILVTTIGQLLYVRVRVRHGDAYEELNFFEVALAVGILVLAPGTVVFAALTGMLLGELIIRRGAWIKVAYNLGNYATATSAMVVTYHLALGALSGGSADPTSFASMVSLVAASAVFTAVNLALLAQLMRATAGAEPREVWREEWRLSALMAVGSVGIGFMAVALAYNAPAALPFAFLPALAIRYAYGASAQHAEARERNRWLVTLGGSLAEHGRRGSTLKESTEAVRQIVAAPEKLILQPVGDSEAMDARSEAILASVWSDPGPRHLATHELPPGWRTGVVTRLDLGSANPGALLLGSTEPHRPSRIAGRTRGWALDDADAPVLGALVAAIGSAMRAGAAFDALTEETAKLSAVVDNTSDGIAMVDDTGQIRLWSQTMARMTGVDASVLDVALADAPEVVRTLVAASRAADVRQGAAPAHVHLVRGDGEELDVSVATVRVPEAATAGAEDAGWVSILTVHDETRERRVEKMKSDFVATISHELRTPITPIKGYAHLLATRGDRVNPEKRAQALRVISDRADHLDRLVDDLLLASQVSDSTRLAIQLGVEDLATIVQESVAGFPDLAARIEVTLPDSPVQVECDRVRAAQCLANLLRNAEKYTPADSLIEIRAEVAGSHARIHVRDHGEGIPAAEEEKVFNRFYRREDPFTMRTSGTGLGLHIARELAIAMGGGLTLQQPSEGSGAEFVLHLRTKDASPGSGTDANSELTTDHDTPATDDDLTRALAEGGTMDPAVERRAAM